MICRVVVIGKGSKTIQDYKNGALVSFIPNIHINQMSVLNYKIETATCMEDSGDMSGRVSSKDEAGGR